MKNTHTIKSLLTSCLCLFARPGMADAPDEATIMEPREDGVEERPHQAGAHPLHPILCLLAATLLTSCGGIAWNFAGRVAELPETCIGVDVTRPAGGVLYVPQGQEKEDYPDYVVMQAPELSYCPRSHIVASGDWATMERLVADEVRPTGRQVWVCLPRVWSAQATRHECRPTVVPMVYVGSNYGATLGDPGLMSEEAARQFRSGGSMARYNKRAVLQPLVLYKGSDQQREKLLAQLCPGQGLVNPKGIARLESSRSAWGPLANAAALPLVLVDVGLGITTNVAMVGTALVLAPVTAPFIQQQKSEPSTAEKP